MYIAFWTLMYIGLKIHTLKHICIIPFFLEKQPSSFSPVKFSKNKGGKFSDKDGKTHIKRLSLGCRACPPPRNVA